MKISSKTIEIKVPVNDNVIRDAAIGDRAFVSGVILTARDRAHKYICENLIGKKPINIADRALYDFLRKYLINGVIYHCGPIIKSFGGDTFKVISAGPTTSIREEPYMPSLIREFRVKVIIGKGGVGENTKQAMQENGCIYLQAVGGAAVEIAESVKKIVDVRKKEFGTPEAMWLLEVDKLQAYVSADSHKNSLHDRIKLNSEKNFSKLKF